MGAVLTYKVTEVPEILSCSLAALGSG